MIVSDRDRLVVVSFRDGRVRKKGPIVGYVSRGKKICAVVAVKRHLVAVPISEVEIVLSRRRK